jgi:feruloyl esterase
MWYEEEIPTSRRNVPPNAAEIIKQWSDVHGLPVQPSFEAMVDGYPRQVWVNAAGDELIESYTIPSMAHGTPLATGAADDQCGATGPFLLEVGISSSYHIARFFGLAANRRASESSRRPLRARVPKMLNGAEGAKASAEPARRRGAGAELPAKRDASTPRYRCGHRRRIEKRRSLKERLAIGIIYALGLGWFIGRMGGHSDY